jgi:hypothetical protein
MADDEPTIWTIDWFSGPIGSPRVVRLVFGLGAAPDREAAKALADEMETAATIGQLKGVLLGFAERQDLRILSFLDQPDHADPLNLVISVGLVRQTL